MWDNAEVVALLDQHGQVRAISRNEAEAPIRRAIGRHVLDQVHADCLPKAEEAWRAAMAGEEREILVALVADDGSAFWNRVRLTRSPMEDSWVLLHARRLPRSWQLLSEREREVIGALNDSGMNPKRAAKQLGIALNTLNAHRRSICQKCQLQGVGEFWVFVERCR